MLKDFIQYKDGSPLTLSMIMELSKNGFFSKNQNQTCSGSDFDIDKAKESARKAAELYKQEISDYVIQFQSSVDKVDNEVFLKAVELYSTVNDINELGHLLKTKTDFNKMRSLCEYFKKCIRQVVITECEKLRMNLRYIE